jgi:hypothetical protein
MFAGIFEHIWSSFQMCACRAAARRSSICFIGKPIFVNVLFYIEIACIIGARKYWNSSGNVIYNFLPMRKKKRREKKKVSKIYLYI